MSAYNYKIEIWNNDVFTNRTLLYMDYKEASEGWKKAIAHFEQTYKRIMLKIILDDVIIIDIWKGY